MALRASEHVARTIASLFDNEEDSDCVIVFCLEPFDQASEQEGGEPAAKRKRLERRESGGSGPLEADTIGTPLPGHQLVLRASSERFRAQLRRWVVERPDSGSAARAAPSSAGNATDGRPMLRVPLGSETEVPFARAAIRFAYTGHVAAGSINEALEVLRQATYLGIEGCATACCEVVKAKLHAEGSHTHGRSSSVAARATGTDSTSSSSSEEDDDDEGLPPFLELYVSSHLWPNLDEEPGFAASLKAASALAKRYFKDVLTILNSRELLKQVLDLPAKGLEALLEANDFGTDSESSVLLLLLAWWMHTNFSQTDADTRAALCRHVRLAQLSPLYLSTVLPALALDYETPGPSSPAAWFPISVAEAAYISRLAAAGSVERKALLKAGRTVYNLQSPWYRTDPRPQCVPPNGLPFLWHVPEADLVASLASLKPGFTRRVNGRDGAGKVMAVFATGLEFTPGVRCNSGGSGSWAEVLVDIPRVLKVPHSRLAKPETALAAVGLSARLSAHYWKDGKRMFDAGVFQADENILMLGEGARHRLSALQPVLRGQVGKQQWPGDEGRRDVAAFARYLRRGWLTGGLTLLL